MSAITLLELTQTIKKQIDQRFHGQTYWVIAEVTNLKFYDSKNYYFLELVQKEENGTAIVANTRAW